MFKYNIFNACNTIFDFVNYCTKIDLVMNIYLDLIIFLNDFLFLLYSDISFLGYIFVIFNILKCYSTLRKEK